MFNQEKFQLRDNLMTELPDYLGSSYYYVINGGGEVIKIIYT
jgi:hypothetical protein